MTIETSADLGTVTQLLTGGQYANVKIGVGAVPDLQLPGPRWHRAGRSRRLHLQQGAALEQAAAWLYLSYQWNSRARPRGPPAPATSRSARRRPRPPSSTCGRPSLGYKVAYNEIDNGQHPATAGSVIGPYEDVRTDVLNAEISMYTGGVSPANRGQDGRAVERRPAASRTTTAGSGRRRRDPPALTATARAGSHDRRDPAGRGQGGARSRRRGGATRGRQ